MSEIKSQCQMSKFQKGQYQMSKFQKFNVRFQNLVLDMIGYQIYQGLTNLGYDACQGVRMV